MKNLFIPHPGNDHHPHLLRTEALLFFLILTVAGELLLLGLALDLIPPSSLLSAIVPSVLMDTANVARAADHLPPLMVHPLLQQAAALKAQDMARKGYFAHTSPEGITPWYWLDQVGYRYSVAGENLAVNFIDSYDVHDAWMSSPSHRANILNSGYAEIGIATAEGIYQGNPATFVVQFFGKPRSKIAVAPAEVAAASAVPTPAVSIAPLAVATPTPQYRVFAAPRRTVQHVLATIAGLLAAALGLTVIVMRGLPHPRIAIPPLVFLLVIFSVLLMNEHLAWFKGLIS